MRRRIELRKGTAETSPPPGTVVDLVFVDSSHEREDTVAVLRGLAGAVAPGGVVAFHDYEEPLFPGVTEAIRELGLPGEVHGHLFVWQKPTQPDSPA